MYFCWEEFHHQSGGGWAIHTTNITLEIVVSTSCNYSNFYDCINFKPWNVNKIQKFNCITFFTCSIIIFQKVLFYYFMICDVCKQPLILKHYEKSVQLISKWESYDVVTMLLFLE